MSRFLFLVYGIVCYAIFFATFLYAVGFVTGLYVPKVLDGPPAVSFGRALMTDLVLLGLFALQHSLMARPAFKKKWTRIIPQPIERSTYVLCSSICLLLLFYGWEPIGGVIWSTSSTLWSTLLLSLSLSGFLIVLFSTFLINHFDLFGLQQVYKYFRRLPYPLSDFKTPGLYKIVRHPIYLGFNLAFWATGHMTVAHLIFAVMTSAYMLVGIALEERDLIQVFGSKYLKYKLHVPMLIPFTGPKHKNEVHLPKHFGGKPYVSSETKTGRKEKIQS